MNKIPPAVSKRLISSVPKFKKILDSAKERDVNESDTVTIVTDMLEEIFGFDKYSEITKEYPIQGTYCDFAVKTGEKINYLIEVKAIGLNLKHKHLKQAVDYAAREGIKWVVLTNAVQWEIYRVSFGSKVSNEQLFTFNISTMNVRQKDQQKLLFLLCKRGVKKDLIDDFYKYKQAINPYIIGALLSTTSIARVVCKELRKLKPGIKVNVEDISGLIKDQVLKRDIVESETGHEASKQISKYIKKQEKAKVKAKST